MRALPAALALLAAVRPAAGADRGSGVLPVSPAAPVQSALRSTSSDWAKYCGNLEMTGRANSERKITRQTAPSLRLLWTKTLGGSIGSSPSVAGGTVYVGDWSGTEWALDAATGAEKATASLGSTHVAHCSPPDLGITSSPVVSGGRIYLAGGDESFYALDADTLAVAWSLPLGDNSATGGYYGWCSPALAGGKLLQGVSSNCDNPFVPGKIVALDPQSGALLGEADFSTPGELGGGEWTSPAVDLMNGSIFVTTASAGDYSVLHAYSILRISLDDLSIQDAWKLQPVTVEDADWGSSPTLFTDGSGELRVGAGQKDGFYYCFARNHLAPGPVWKTEIAQGGPCPQCAQGTLSTAAFDGTRLYVGGGQPPGNPPAGVKGSVAALDPGNGQILWRFSGFNGPVIAPVSTANGVVFAAGGTIAVGLDAATGDVLWSFTTANICFGGIAIADGRLFFGDLAGNLYAVGVGP